MSTTKPVIGESDIAEKAELVLSTLISFSQFTQEMRAGGKAILRRTYIILSQYRLRYVYHKTRDRIIGYCRKGRTCVLITINLSPSTIHHSPFTIHLSPFTIHNPRSTIHYPLSTIHYPPSTIHHSPFTIHHSKFNIQNSTFNIHQSPVTSHQSPVTSHRSTLNAHHYHSPYKIRKSYVR
jgi:hypothetical protein